MDSIAELQAQWTSPGDILSLLLLIGGDIVQRAITQLVGHQIRIPGFRNGASISVAPVAFSFGWVAYGFSNLLAATGEMKLMPPTEKSALLVNCSNGFARETKSWVLNRLLRDHEIRHEVDSRSKEEGGRAESIRVDVFELGPVPDGTSCRGDFVWWAGWVVILVQVAIAIVPRILYGAWDVLVITLCGNALAAITCAMPQWNEEKWAGRALGHEKVTFLTRGNGYGHIMVFIGRPGSYNLESLATASTVPRPETRWLSLALAVAWTCILLSTSGIKENTWFLICIGGLGMLQNVFAAGIPRKPRASRFDLKKYSRISTIIGVREAYVDDTDSTVDLAEDLVRLNDVSAWLSEKNVTPVSLRNESGDSGTSSSINFSSEKSRSMPRWLTTMSKEDGVPDWLETVKPQTADGSFRRLSASPKTTTTSTTTETTPSTPPHSVTSTTRRWFGSTEREQDDATVVHAVGVHGALIELEKWVPTAGLAALQMFFQGGLSYNDDAIRDNVHKKFWRRAYHTKSLRKKAEEKRRRAEWEIYGSKDV